MIQAAAMSRFVGQTLKSYTAEVTTEALEEITALIEAGALVPVIDRNFPLEDPRKPLPW